VKFWVRFYKEEGESPWFLAQCQDFDSLTQGKDLEEARKMAKDLLTINLDMAWNKGKKVKPRGKPEGEGWELIEVPASAMLALNLKRERLAQGKTMQEVADSLGVAVGTYQRWEDPYKANPTIATLQKLAMVLGKRLEVSIK
jgi:antitoxin HicB